MYSVDDLVTSVLSKKFTLLQWNPVTTTTTTTILIIIIIIIMVYLTHPWGGFPVKILYLQLKINKNALSSVESRLLGDIVVKGAGSVILLFYLECKTSVICHNVNTQKVKLVRRDRPNILASNWCETFENLLHIDNAPLRSTLSGILRSKN